MNKVRFVVILAVLGIALISAVPALAVCVPDGTAGPDAIVCTGTDPDGVNGGLSGDTITVVSGATVNGAINGGAGADSICVNSGGTVNGNVEGGIGGDSICVDGTVNGTVNGGAGSDSITVGGLVNGLVFGGASGNDFILITPSGTVVGTVAPGQTGNNTIIIQGTVTNNVFGSLNGNTYIGVTGTGSVGNAIFGLAGDDTVNLEDGAGVPYAGGGPGYDTLSFVFTCTTDSEDEEAMLYSSAEGLTGTSGSFYCSGRGLTWAQFENLLARINVNFTGFRCGQNPYRFWADQTGPYPYERPFIQWCHCSTGDPNEALFDGLWLPEVCTTFSPYAGWDPSLASPPERVYPYERPFLSACEPFTGDPNETLYSGLWLTQLP